MKIADILRVLANNLDHPQGGAPDPALQNPAGLIDVAPTQEPKSSAQPQEKTPSGNDVSPEEVFLPPLQLKQELLKKAVGVKNVYDDGPPGDQAQRETPEQDNGNQEDIVDRIRYLGGVPVAALQELSNDEIFDD